MGKRKPPVKKKQAEPIGGPYLAFAVLCENALQETDQVQSLIRMFDKATPVIPPGIKLPPGGLLVKLKLAIGFKSGDFVGKKQLDIDISGRKKSIPQIEVLFQGNEHGPVVFVEMNLATKKSELLWIDVRLGGELVTRVPLRIVFEKDLDK